mgnify:CR=1 FL=1
MTSTKIVIALGIVVGAVLLETTVFEQIQPFGYAPALGILAVIATSRYLTAEPALFVAFSGGFLEDLLGGSPLGLWASTFTIVAFVTLKIRDREIAGPLAVLAGVFGLTVLGEFTYAVLGTLFGQGIIGRPGFVWHLLVPALYNVVLAYPVFWLTRAAIRPKERTWAT